jgi:hypothetical protein
MTVESILANAGLSRCSRVAMLAACCMLSMRGQLRTWNFMYLSDSTARAAVEEISL